ncbi:hypothetical protein ACOSQ4_026454 [Xanthoceras sorbifolium]
MDDQNDCKGMPNINANYLQYENVEGQPDPLPRDHQYYQQYLTYPLTNHYPPYADPYHGMPPSAQGGYLYDHYQYHYLQNPQPLPVPQFFPPPDNPQIQNLETQIHAITRNLVRVINVVGAKREANSDEVQSRTSVEVNGSRDWSKGGDEPINFDHPLRRRGQRDGGITRSREERDDYVPDPADK